MEPDLLVLDLLELEVEEDHVELPVVTAAVWVALTPVNAQRVVIPNLMSVEFRVPKKSVRSAALQ